MKKLLLSLGTISVATLPIVAVVSCSSDEPYNASYDESKKQLSYSLGAQYNSLGSYALSYDTMISLGQTIASGLKAHPETTQILFNFSVSSDTSKNKTVLIDPAKVFNMMNLAGGQVNNNGVQTTISFDEVSYTGTFSQLINSTPDYKLTSIFNASTTLTYYINMHNTKPTDATGSTNYRMTISESDRTTKISSLIILQALNEKPYTGE